MKTQPQHGWQQPGGLGHSSPEGSICFESVSDVWYGFSHSQDPRVQESGVERETVSLTLNSNDPLGKLLLHVPAILSSSYLEVLVPEGVLSIDAQMPWPL